MTAFSSCVFRVGGGSGELVEGVKRKDGRVDSRWGKSTPWV